MYCIHLRTKGEGFEGFVELIITEVASLRCCCDDLELIKVGSCTAEEPRYDLWMCSYNMQSGKNGISKFGRWFGEVDSR